MPVETVGRAVERVHDHEPGGNGLRGDDDPVEGVREQCAAVALPVKNFVERQPREQHGRCSCTGPCGYTPTDVRTAMNIRAPGRYSARRCPVGAAWRS
nr:hypothetical protein GCM10020063_097140 [Dactylosporangium thailandense]